MGGAETGAGSATSGLCVSVAGSAVSATVSASCLFAAEAGLLPDCVMAFLEVAVEAFAGTAALMGAVRTGGLKPGLLLGLICGSIAFMRCEFERGKGINE